MDARARAEFVEEFALALGGAGTSRIAGRIFAHLLTDDRPHLSLQELAQELDVSKASVSTNARALIAQRMIRRAAVPGSRMEHYRLEPGGFDSALRAVAESAREMAALARRGQDLFGDAGAPGRATLRDMEQVYGRLADLTTDLLSDETRRLP